MFDKDISVIVPYKAADEYREKNWSWIKRRYEILMPNAEICIGNYDGEPFCKSAAINNAAQTATRDIFLIADADIVFDLDQIREAVGALDKYTWVIPYTFLYYLPPEATRELHKRDPSVIMKDIDYTGYLKTRCISEKDGWEWGGGINIVRRRHFEKVGGFDERFKGWGGEDDAFQKVLDAVCGPHIRVEATMWHLYHPLASKENQSKNTRLLKEFYKDKDTILSRFNKKS
jgi:predicted glycosyltransferase involved in capsule biosynthesis